jgi:hypothetical protein
MYSAAGVSDNRSGRGVTRMRFELLGPVLFLTFGCQVLAIDLQMGALKEEIADVLFDKFNDILATGLTVQEEEIIRDVGNIFGGNFWRFHERSSNL